MPHPLELVFPPAKVRGEVRVPQTDLLVDQIEACSINSHRVPRCQDTDVGDDRGIAPGYAVTVRGNAGKETDVAGFLLLRCSKGILYYPFGEPGDLCLPVNVDGIFRADCHALETTDAVIPVNDPFA